MRSASARSHSISSSVTSRTFPIMLTASPYPRGPILSRVRLNAYLARAGVASRRGADELIKAGRVRVNGAAGQLNTFVETGDHVEVDGRAVAAQRLAYVLLHKPEGVVTTARDPQRRPTVVDLVAHEARVVPVGRLDADTTGALLLT